ncbi:sensor domain-containing diguanylate cyclase [Agrilutibacter solisilvae]|uniref:Diguanylate cyclase n=1 Tax=Agrilutibacter solisilvae TaxID=2763317 RepID=A0A974Y1I1_9GAMM|nr:sensor domain-containing diguanylate cyclase [Lysobacter solisilvae]QSX78860.1 diguanylate cyclase [Lysobacter solisilvae]
MYPSLRRPWLDAPLLAVLGGVAAWVTLRLATGNDALSAVWIGNGLLTGWLLSRPTQLWARYLGVGFGAELLARVVSGDAGLHAVALGACDLVEVVIVAGTIRRLVPDIGARERWMPLAGIATASTLVACAVSGVLAAAFAWWVHGSDVVGYLLAWYSSHVVGMVIFATSTVVVQHSGIRFLVARRHRRAFALNMLLVALLTAVVFALPYPLLFLTFPPLLLGAFRHRLAGVTVGICLVTVIASAATAMGYGPLGLVDGLGSTGRIALLQLYIAAACLITMPLALIMAERRRLAEHVRVSEQRYRMLADYSHDVVMRLRADGERLYVSPSAHDVLGWDPGQLLGARWDLLHPDDRGAALDAIGEVISLNTPQTAVYRIRHRDGHYVWVEAVMRPIPSDDGRGMEVISAGRDISRRVAAEQALADSRDELERLARVDVLTGLANRRQLDERFDLALKRLQRHGPPIALMFLDVDRFKHINDTWGHAVGDTVLRTFAQRLRECTRASDLIARLGGDEFVVLIEDAMLPGSAEAIAGKLIATMGAPVLIEGASLHVTTSIGIAYASRPAEATTLMTAADAALYDAKKAGRNTWRMRGVDPPAPGLSVVHGQ